MCKKIPENPESYDAYLSRRVRENENLNLWSHQAFILAVITVGGGIALGITTSGGLGETGPVCTGITCTGQIAGLIYIANLFRHYQ